MDEMTHERCSELLREHVAGDLSGDLASAVRAHLAECPDCRAEESAVRALAAAPAPLDDMERARLHRALAREIAARPANAEVASGKAPDWRRWIAPALGSAAAVLVALLVVTGGLLGGGDDSESTADGASAEVEALEDDTAGGGGSDSLSEKNGNLHSAAGSAAAPAGGGDEPDRSTASQYALGPQPEFNYDRGSLTTDDLVETGRTSDLFRSFADQYRAEDVGPLRRTFLNQLVAAAGPAGSQARRCARTLPETEPILPAYGATGKYEGRDALVLGFVTTDAGSPALDRYLMWVWAKGSCRQPIDTLFDRIDR